MSKKYVFKDPSISRSVDCIPVLPLQEVVCPNMRISHAIIKASTDKTNAKSFEVGSKNDPEYLRVVVNRPDKTIVDVIFGNPDPTIRPEFTLNPKGLTEFVEDRGGGALDILEGGIADAVIKEMNVIEPIPRGIPEDNILHSADNIILQKQATGNFNRKFEVATGIALSNPHKHAILGLLSNHGLNVGSELSKRIRSTEVTTWLGAFNGDNLIGYDTIGKGVTEQLQRMIVAKRWWQDLATFYPFQIPANGHSLDGNLWCLEKEKRFTQF